MSRALLRDLAAFLLPSTCLVCGGRTAGRLPLCPLCSGRLVPPDAHDLSEAAEALRSIDGLTALWMLDGSGPVRALLHGLKYRGLRKVGEEAGRLLGLGLAPKGPFDRVVPVPLHRLRQLERGYNQSEWIAGGVARELRLGVSPDGLARRKASPSQTRSGRTEREEAVRDAFEVPVPGDVADRRVVLVDDVLTTGATASSAAGALKMAGARSVHLATVGLTRAA